MRITNGFFGVDLPRKSRRIKNYLVLAKISCMTRIKIVLVHRVGSVGILTKIMIGVQKSRLLPGLLFWTLKKSLLFWTSEKSLLFWIPEKVYFFGPQILKNFEKSTFLDFRKSLLFWTGRKSLLFWM